MTRSMDTRSSREIGARVSRCRNAPLRHKPHPWSARPSARSEDAAVRVVFVQPSGHDTASTAGRSTISTSTRMDRKRRTE